MKIRNSATSYQEYQPIFNSKQTSQVYNSLERPMYSEVENDLLQMLSPPSSTLSSLSSLLSLINVKQKSRSLTTTAEEAHSENSEFFREFQANLRISVSNALTWINNKIESGLLNHQDVMRWMFPSLIKSKGLDFENIYNFLVSIGDAKLIIDYSIRKVSEGNSSQRYLQLASSLVGDLKKKSLSALTDLFSSPALDESKEFVSTACYLEEISEQERYNLLLLISKSSIRSVREELSSSLEYATFPFRKSLLTALAKHKN